MPFEVNQPQPQLNEKPRTFLDALHHTLDKLINEALPYGGGEAFIKATSEDDQSLIIRITLCMWEETNKPCPACSGTGVHGSRPLVNG